MSRNGLRPTAVRCRGAAHAVTGKQPGKTIPRGGSQPCVAHSRRASTTATSGEMPLPQHQAPSCCSGRDAQRGFSLLETLVAFSILAICLGVLLRIFGGGGRAAVLTDEYARGLAVAESLLASVGPETELALGRKQGIVAGTIRWEIQVSPLPMTSGNLSDLNFPSIPVWVEVSASWGADQQRAVRLNTIRLLPSNPSGGAPNLPPRRPGT